MKRPTPNDLAPTLPKPGGNYVPTYTNPSTLDQPCAKLAPNPSCTWLQLLYGRCCGELKRSLRCHPLQLTPVSSNTHETFYVYLIFADKPIPEDINPLSSSQVTERHSHSIL